MSQLPTITDNGLERPKPLARQRDSRPRAQTLQKHKDTLLDLAPAAIRTLKRLLRAESERVRLDAAKAIVDRAGLLPSSESDSSAADNLAELSASELRRIADRLEGELAARARPINASLANKDGEKTLGTIG